MLIGYARVSTDDQTLDQQRWSTSDAGYEVADTRALWDWEWSGQILSAINEPLAWQIEVRAPQTAPLRVPDGEPIDVRGTTGVLVEPMFVKNLLEKVKFPLVTEHQLNDTLGRLAAESTS